jgi:hypothetical protein
LSDLLPALLGNAVVHEKPGIKRAITYVNGDGLLTLKTEGNIYSLVTETREFFRLTNEYFVFKVLKVSKNSSNTIRFSISIKSIRTIFTLSLERTVLRRPIA